MLTTSSLDVRRIAFPVRICYYRHGANLLIKSSRTVLTTSVSQYVPVQYPELPAISPSRHLLPDRNHAPSPDPPSCPSPTRTATSPSLPNISKRRVSTTEKLSQSPARLGGMERMSNIFADAALARQSTTPLRGRSDTCRKGDEPPRDVPALVEGIPSQGGQEHKQDVTSPSAKAKDEWKTDRLGTQHARAWRSVSGNSVIPKRSTEPSPSAHIPTVDIETPQANLRQDLARSDESDCSMTTVVQSYVSESGDENPLEDLERACATTPSPAQGNKSQRRGTASRVLPPQPSPWTKFSKELLSYSSDEWTDDNIFLPKSCRDKSDSCRRGRQAVIRQHNTATLDDVAEAPGFRSGRVAHTPSKGASRFQSPHTTHGMTTRSKAKGHEIQSPLKKNGDN